MARLRALLTLAVLAAAAASAQDDALPQPPRVESEFPALADPAETRTELDTLRAARDTLAAASDFPAALQSAENIVETATDETDPVYRDDIMQLARIQVELDLFADAEVNYLRAIELAEEADGTQALSLVEPYHALGRAYLDERRFTEAITVFEHARDINQRHLGLFNVEQTPLIDDVTLAWLGLGDTLQARELQLDRLDNAVRRFGADDPRVIPYHNRLAEYYGSSRMRTSAREQYERILEIQETQGGSDNPVLLATLRRLAGIELLLGDDDDAKLRLEELLQATADEVSVERSLSLALLGDWALVDEDFELAADYYRQAHAALDATGEADPDEVFAAPRMIDFIPPLTRVDLNRRSRPWAWGSIELAFDLSADGRAWNVRVVAVEPAGVVESAYHRRLRETHFRPRLVAGAPVAVNDVRFTHFFRFYVEQD